MKLDIKTIGGHWHPNTRLHRSPSHRGTSNRCCLHLFPGPWFSSIASWFQLLSSSHLYNINTQKAKAYKSPVFTPASCHTSHVEFPGVIKILPGAESCGKCFMSMHLERQLPATPRVDPFYPAIHHPVWLPRVCEDIFHVLALHTTLSYIVPLGL